MVFKLCLILHINSFFVKKPVKFNSGVYKKCKIKFEKHKNSIPWSSWSSWVVILLVLLFSLFKIKSSQLVLKGLSTINCDLKNLMRSSSFVLYFQILSMDLKSNILRSGSNFFFTCSHHNHINTLKRQIWSQLPWSNTLIATLAYCLEVHSPHTSTAELFLFFPFILLKQLHDVAF